MRSSLRRSAQIQAAQQHQHQQQQQLLHHHHADKDKAKVSKKDVFLADLAHFHKSTGSPVRNKPIINGKVVDLYVLYNLVQENGGWLKLNSQGLWDTLLSDLGIPTACVNGGVAVRQVYLRYLEKYDRAKNASLGLQGAGGDGDVANAEVDDDRPRRGFWGTPRPRNTAAQPYNHTQHQVPEHIRESVGLAPLQKLGGPVERLTLSLLSPFPNEQDFALNVCTILAVDTANKLPVLHCPHVVDFLLGHAAVYNHQSIRDVIGKSYREARNVEMKTFWEERSRPIAILELLDESKFPIQGLSMQALVSEISLNSCLSDGAANRGSEEKEPPPEENPLLLEDEDGLFASYCDGGARDMISRRISQVATIMRNLSFHDDNLTILAKNQTFLRFALLCANNSMSSIRQMGMDAFGNVAQEMTVKDPAVCILSKHLFATLSASMCSEDRAKVLFALEVLNKLAQNEANEEVLLRCLEQNIYEQVCSYLTLHDIMLLVVTLECMYALTTLGEKACDYIVRVHGVMDTLVSLITVEAQSYGPKACILMRVVETVPGGQMLPQHQHQPQVAPAPRPMTPPNATVSNVQMQLQTGVMPLAPQQLMQTVQQGQNQASVSQNPKSTSTNLTTATATATVSIQQQHAQQQVIQENEQFALAWLRTTWEPCSTAIRLDATELYKQYTACCTKVGRKGVIAPFHFPRCVRSIFGGVVGPNISKGPNGEVQQYYIGIRQRPSPVQNKPQQLQQQQPQSNAKTGPASPILKAQLSKMEQAKPQNAHPHLSLALEGGMVNTPTSPPHQQPSTTTNLISNPNPPTQSAPNNTTLIKHLLAHKVSPAPSTLESDRMITQVAQRQNQQRLMGQTAATPSPAPTPVQAPPPVINSNNAAISMEIDAEALISCSTITASGVTSTEPALGLNVPPLAPLSQGSSENSDISKTEILDHVPPPIVIPTTSEESIVNNNKMLTDLLEKKSAPPNIPPSLSEPESTTKNIDDDDSGEPEAKKPREAVSSKAANLYAALAADALEDEEELAATAQAEQNASAIPAPTVAIEEPIIAPVITTQVIPTGVSQPTVIQQQIVTAEAQPDSEAVRQVIVPTLTNQGGQIILHTAPPKPPTSFVTQPGQIQLIASPSPQGIGYVSQGVVPHKTIIIVQNGPGGNPITLTVNNPAGIDESALGNIISQASDMINQQQQQQQANQAAAVVQTTPGLLQTSTGVIQTNQPTTGLIQTNLAGQQPVVIKQQLVQNTPQLVATTQQPQSQLITASGQQIIVQGNQAFLTSNQQLIGGNQKILVGNQQIVMGNPQLVVGNQQIMAGQQQVILNTGQAFSAQQIVTMAQTFQTTTQQQIVTSGQQQPKIVSGNPMIGGGTQSIVISSQGEKKVIVNNPKLVQGPNIVQQQQANNITNKIIPNQPDNQVTMVQQPPPVVEPPRVIPDEPWVCQWKGCDTVFENASMVYSHACSTHCVVQESPCLWAYCDQLPRKRFSLMTHLQDKHCSVEAMKASLAQRRKGIIPQTATAQGSTNQASTMERIDSPGPEPATGITHPGYAPNAALHAIKRHAVDFLNPRELMDDNEGPVTKSIRLTAALILRNIVLYSHSGKRLLRGYEPHLAGIALSSVEASRTVAQVLYDMHSI